MEQKSKQIVKNTLMLYIRMFVTMGIGLYTGRVILDTLGIEDYGIYGVVGGVVGMSSLLTSALTAAVWRFITVEIGRGDKERLRTVFATSVVIQIILGVVVLILMESVGLWFVTHKLVIPPDRMYAAKWAFHLSMITGVVMLVRIPYAAVIIAHERMSFFALQTIIEAVSKLVIAYCIVISPIDKLVFFSILTLISSMLIHISGFAYARVNFEECRGVKLKYDNTIFKEMFGYAGWVFIGSTAGILREQGGSIILNMFGGGPAINAAKSVSSRVVAAVTTFSSNFMSAVSPQITKSHASGERSYMMNLVYVGSRYSYYMLLILSLPVLLNTNYILILWLKDVPDHTVLFIQLSLILCLIDSLSGTLMTAVSATGDIRNYQIVVGGVNLLNFPLSYLLLKQGLFPEVVVLVSIFLAVICIGLRLYMIRRIMEFPVMDFVKRVVINVISVTVVSVVVPLLTSYIVPYGFTNFVVVTSVSFLMTAIAIYAVGCGADERAFVRGYVKRFLLKFISRNKSQT